jgi:hypothetical protein
MVATESKTYFPDSLKAAYSHGLETIYALETIDVKSVRRMSEKAPAKPEAMIVHEEIEENQLDFDLGVGFRSWIIPTLLSEPIQILDLKKPLERQLLDKCIGTLGELVQAVNHLPASLGHGNIEDIRRSLARYIAGKSQDKTHFIDFLSLIKCLYGDFDAKKVYAALAPKGLGEWIVLTPLDKVDLKKASLEVRLNWIQETKHHIRSEKKQAFLQQQFFIWCQTWVKPWLIKRNGFGTQEEIEALLILRSSDEQTAEQVLVLLRDMIVYETFLPCYEGVFAADARLLNYLRSILKKKSTYYCSSYANYSVSELTHLIYQEMVRDWSSVTPEIIQKALSLFFPIPTNITVR